VQIFFFISQPRRELSMKLQMKLIAAAVALIGAAGGAQADLVALNNGSLALVAFNQVTRAYYIRDTGFLMNDFLPSSVTTGSGDGGVTGTRTPEAGLTLDKTNTASFADAAWSAWFSGQTAADIKWFVSSPDVGSTAGTTNVRRGITSSANPAQTATNGLVSNYALGAAGVGTLAGTFTLSTSGTSGALASFDSNFGLGAAGLSSLDSDAGLFYFAQTQGSGGAATVANKTQFGNSGGFAIVKLASNGDFSYTLAPAAAVPLPAAVWLMGAGLLGVAGAVRRRKAAVQA
jgi:hypothetical protein